MVVNTLVTQALVTSNKSTFYLNTLTPKSAFSLSTKNARLLRETVKNNTKKEREEGKQTKLKPRTIDNHIITVPVRF